MWFRSYSYLASQRTLCTPGSYTITNIVNMSFSSGNFHYTLKESVISPLLNKSTLDKDELSNYRPISNLSLISKIIERVVKSRLSDHFISNNLVVNPHQSAYCKHHSTETALLCIHDHLINAIGWLKKFVSAFSICLWYHWPQYLTHSSILLVWHSWHCIKLVQVLSFV